LQWQLQLKDGFYHDWFPTNTFLPLVVEIFKCLHQKVNIFLNQCANMTWGAKGIGGPPLSILHTFYSGITMCIGNFYFEMCYCSRWGSFYARCPFKRSSPFLIWYVSCDKKGFENLMFPLWFTFC
jgi:hypothetical protein